ncbi:hypothetical protein R80B4_00244 [Fibrobacteres bacterium R8-0-B4]
MLMDEIVIKHHKAEVERYCIENNLSPEKFFNSAGSCDKTSLFILGKGDDPKRAKLGLADNVPLPVALEIYLENGKLRFEQTEHTRKYLGVEDEAKLRVA